MSWRTVVISGRCKLDLKMGYMVIRGEEIRRVYLEEISSLIIENNAVALTGCLLEALVNKNVKVIFCDSKRNPCSELVPMYGSHDTSRKIRRQAKWSDEVKSEVWTAIVTEKIRNQAKHLADAGMADASALLCKYIGEIKPNDAGNREGHAAKVYFNSLFGKEFNRNLECPTNAALNYGYGIMLSTFNREVSANGYLTQLGLFHDNTYNQFNLSSDLMEPFRICIDRKVRQECFEQFERKEKYAVLAVMNEYVEIDGMLQTVANAVKIYVRSVFEAIEQNNISLIRFAEI